MDFLQAGISVRKSDFIMNVRMYAGNVNHTIFTYLFTFNYNPKFINSTYIILN